MLSRARNLLEDQLLGFALVPISQIVSQGGKISCQNFSLSSTDLFHSPAGTVQLSLSLSTNLSSVSPLNSSANNPFRNFSGNSSISSEVVLLDPNDYSRVEFPDINAATEDQVMISEYFNSNTCSLGSFLHLGSALKAEYDYEMAGNSSEENENENENSRDESNRNSGILSSTTSISDDRNTADSNSASDQQTPTPTQPETGESQSKVGGDGIGDQREKINEIEDCTGESSGYGNTGRVFTNRVRNAGLEVEQAAMQQQIVDMYMKSMQQFTESLANMKLPMELHSGTDNKTSGNVIRIMERNNDLDVENKKKDGSRVFYGSRAFF
ncbi:uncharacterized protein LOC110736289 isoform X2 [Chenopodium quinoa]|nr:uncharacterized protein LOC110736289 isoform X2 [Chenopodium quinoa]